MVRNTQVFRYNEYGRGQGQRHSGTDIAAREGTPLIAPIPLFEVWATLAILPQPHRVAVEPRRTNDPIISSLNSTPMTMEVPLYWPGTTKPVIDPATGKQRTYMKSGVVTNPFFLRPFDPKTEIMVEAYAQYYDNYITLKYPSFPTKYCPKPYFTGMGARSLTLWKDMPHGQMFTGYGWYTPPDDLQWKFTT